MDNLHNKRMSPYEKIEALESIRCQIQGSWRTDEIRRQKPTPQVCLSGQKAACVNRQPGTAIDHIRPDLSVNVRVRLHPLMAISILAPRLNPMECLACAIMRESPCHLGGPSRAGQVHFMGAKCSQERV